MVDLQDVTLAILLLAGCASAPPAGIPIQSGGRELSGRWVGEYTSATTGRRGTIFFELTGGRAKANGFVVMYSNVVAVPDAPLAAGSRVSGPATDVLAIEFVQAASGQISGQLATYRDPATGGTLRTRFEGVQSGDTIEGTFVSQPDGSGPAVHGTWRVTRQRR